MILLTSLSVLFALSLVVNVLLYRNVKHSMSLTDALKTTNQRTQEALHKIGVQAEEFKMKVYSLNLDLKQALDKLKMQKDEVKPSSQNGTQSGQPTTPKVVTKKYYKKSPKKNPNTPSSSK